MTRSRALFVGLVITCVLVVGCATTKPWEREDLAKPEMALDGTHPQTLRHHYLSVREGAIGGTGSGGGGCGCN